MPGNRKIKIDVEEDAPDGEALSADQNEALDAPDLPGDDVAEFEQDLAAAKREAKESYDRFLRASAELQNFKKRKEREMADLRKFANESLLKDLLSVADNLERAVELPPNGGDDSRVVEGVHLTLKELLKIFQKFGVQPIEALGEPFDPAYHEAMMQQTVADQPDNTVVQELQKGYVIHDRLLRPAKVVVSKLDTHAGAGDSAEHKDKT